MEKEITVTSNRGKRFLDWIESKSKPVQALLATCLFFTAITLLLGSVFTIYTVFGLVGSAVVVIFGSVYLYILNNIQ